MDELPRQHVVCRHLQSAIHLPAYQGNLLSGRVPLACLRSGLPTEAPGRSNQFGEFTTRIQPAGLAGVLCPRHKRDHHDRKTLLLRRLNRPKALPKPTTLHPLRDNLHDQSSQKASRHFAPQKALNRRTREAVIHVRNAEKPLNRRARTAAPK